MKIYVQNMPVVFSSTTPLSAYEERSGSMLCNGYSKLVGMYWTNASAGESAACGLHFQQSSNYGSTWDYTSASYAVNASVASVFSLDIYGNAVKIKLIHGADAASLVRYNFMLRPI